MAFALLGKGVAQDKDGTKTDDQLMAAWSRGNRSAFDEIYDRYKQPLYGYLIRNCADESLANELFQDVWLRVISHTGAFKHHGRFRSWIFTLAHNRLVDFYRKAENRTINESVDDLVSTDNPAERIDNQEKFAHLEQVVRTLPLEQKQAFYLREEAGFAIREIAEIQDITIEAAKSRLRYAYRKLREAMGEENES